MLLELLARTDSRSLQAEVLNTLSLAARKSPEQFAFLAERLRAVVKERGLVCPDLDAALEHIGGTKWDSECSLRLQQRKRDLLSGGGRAAPLPVSSPRHARSKSE